MKDRYPRLTPMRAFDLLTDLNRTEWNDAWKVTRAKEALSSHIKAALVTKKKRKAARVVKLRSVG